ncbi:MAG: prepilin-type N-terminal cleavage/methylation domain-containing protein [Phycisphaerales bacterium]|jgi:prepilin-type N-terminal cleavage/methylation domain-containing protein
MNRMMNNLRRGELLGRGAGFSLVEVLIAVVVLSLGLLGLAAVFPAVLTQQKQASDASLGAATARSAQAFLQQSPLSEKSPVYDTNGALLDLTSGQGTLQRRGWDQLTAALSSNPWSPKEEWTTASDQPIFEVNADTGDIKIGVITSEVVQIKLIDRLSPRPYGGAGESPRYVWDFAARRISAPEFGRASTGLHTPTAQDSVQVAIFVRRIDNMIRVPEGKTLNDVLTGTNLTNVASRRLPVAQDGTGRPTYDGVGAGGTGALNYSDIKRISYTLGTTLGPGGYETISFPTGGLSEYAQQLGQKFVDQFGVVHTVTEVIVDTTGPSPVNKGVKLSPPVASDIALMAPNSAEGTPQMLFTVQIPVAVLVFEERR